MHSHRYEFSPTGLIFLIAGALLVYGAIPISHLSRAETIITGVLLARVMPQILNFTIAGASRGLTHVFLVVSLVIGILLYGYAFAALLLNFPH